MLWLLLACTGDPGGVPEPDADVFVAVEDLGDPIAGLDAETLTWYQLGRDVMERAFTTDQGLGPTINADSCGSCHQFPVPGGSAPRYRDFWLVKTERWDGALEDAGTNGASPVRNLYAVAPLDAALGGHPAGHISEPEDTVLYARRNTPSAFGIGLLEFIEDETILALEDPDDADDDGISGRANYEQGSVGRFGYKSQASSMESFNRGAMLNQMGLTSNPLFYEFPDQPLEDRRAGADDSGALGWRAPAWPEDWRWGGIAHAQVSAPGQPTTDDDGVADPEMSDADQLGLLLFSTYLAAPQPSELDEQTTWGQALFDEAGCADCHVPRLDSALGPLPLYSDLLLHDMGDDRADGIGGGYATGVEFRTQPLWGVALTGPWLHDGAADTLEQAIAMHGGEATRSAVVWRSFDDAEQAALVAFLRALGGEDPGQKHFTVFQDVPDAGEPGGPLPGLTEDELALWLEGRDLFDRNARPVDGLGAWFNADSCRACHQDPVLGGAGGIDTNVVRMGHRDADGLYSGLERNALPRSAMPGSQPYRMPDDANLVELRQPPTVLGVGLIDGISEDAVVAADDPDDADGDGISGRARWLDDGRLGRFGWKAQVPSLVDFAADALLNEVGLTVDAGLTDFSAADDGDGMADPEFDTDAWMALTFYLENLSPPAPAAEGTGADLFDSLGCAACHTPQLDGVPLYSDLLLHDLGGDASKGVEQDAGVLASEFRTPPLWDVGETAPYMHDGSAASLRAAIEAHGGEAEAARDAFDARAALEQETLLEWLAEL